MHTVHAYSNLRYRYSLCGFNCYPRVKAIYQIILPYHEKACKDVFLPTSNIILFDIREDKVAITMYEENQFSYKYILGRLI